MTSKLRSGGLSTDSPRSPKGPDARSEHIWLWRLVSLVAFFAIWTAAVEFGVISQRLFATPLEAFSWLIDWFVSGRAWTHLSATVQGALYGAIAGLVLGALVAALFAFVPLIAQVMDPFMAIVNGVPKIVIAPLVILIFGLGMPSKVAIAGLLVFFVTFFNLYSGLTSVDRRLIANLRILGARRRHMLIDLYLPAIVTWIFATLRISIGFALIGVIVGEFVGSTRGVGWTIKVSSEQLLPDQLFGALIALAIVAVIVDVGLSRVERRFSQRSVF